MKNVTGNFLFNDIDVDRRLTKYLAKNKEVDDRLTIVVNDFEYVVDSDNEMIKVYIPIYGNLELLGMYDSSSKGKDPVMKPEGRIGRYDFADGYTNALVLFLKPEDTEDKDDILPFIKDEVKTYKDYLKSIDLKVKKHNQEDIPGLVTKANEKSQRKQNFENRFRK